MIVLTEGYLAETAATACSSCDRWQCWQCSLTATDSVYKTSVSASSVNVCCDINKLWPSWLRHIDTSLTASDPPNYTDTTQISSLFHNTTTHRWLPPIHLATQTQRRSLTDYHVTHCTILHDVHPLHIVQITQVLVDALLSVQQQSALYAIASPSVHRSVTRVDQSKTAEARIIQLSPSCSPIRLVFVG